MTCEFCLRLQDDKFREECAGIEYVTECPKKEVPKLMEENERFVWFFARIGPGLWNGMGGKNLNVIGQVCEIYGVPEGERPVILDLCLAISKGAEEARDRSGAGAP
jgi:hypothetical protein